MPHIAKSKKRRTALIIVGTVTLSKALESTFDALRTWARFTLENWLQENGHHQLYKLISMEWLSTIWSFLTSPYAIGFAVGAVVFGFWDWLIRPFPKKKMSADIVHLIARKELLATELQKINDAMNDYVPSLKFLKKNYKMNSDHDPGGSYSSDMRTAKNKFDSALRKIENAFRTCGQNDARFILTDNYKPSLHPLRSIDGQHLIVAGDQRLFWDQATNFNHNFAEHKAKIQRELEEITVKINRLGKI